MKKFSYNIAGTNCARRKTFIIIASGLPGNHDLPENYQEIFRDQISYQRIVNLLIEAKNEEISRMVETE